MVFFRNFLLKYSVHYKVHMLKCICWRLFTSQTHQDQEIEHSRYLEASWHLLPVRTHISGTNSDHSPGFYLQRFVLQGYHTYFINVVHRWCRWRRWLIHVNLLSLLGNITPKYVKEAIFFFLWRWKTCAQLWKNVKTQDESHRCNVAWKKSDTEYIFHDFIFTKLGIRQN